MAAPPGGSDTDTETTIHTEPSAGDPYREAFAPYRVGHGNPAVQAFRQWWLQNPLNNLWTKKPNMWRTYQAEQAGADPAEAVRSGANVRLDDLVQRGPTLQDVLNEGEYELVELPSDEAWFGTPDPDIYAPGTNDLSKDQLAEEVAKGNVCTLRQLKQHLATATDDELKVWQKLFAAQTMKEEMFIDLPEGRVSLWDLLSYVKGNPELAQLADRDINLAVPVEGMTRSERIAVLSELAPWKLCGNDRQMSLPPHVAARLPWGLLAGGSWWNRRPSRWLKGLDGRRDFYYGLYVHEAAAEQLLGPSWGGVDPQQVLADKAFYREALGLAPSLGMTVLAVASRPLHLEELTQSWEERVKQQIDKLGGDVGSSSSSRQQQQQPQVMFSTSSGSLASVSGSESESGSGQTAASSEEEGSSSSEAVAAAAYTAARKAAAKAAPVQQPQQPPPSAVLQQQAAAAAASAPVQQQQQQLVPQQLPPQQQQQQQPTKQLQQQQQATTPPPQQPQPQPQHLQQQQQQQHQAAAASSSVAAAAGAAAAVVPLLKEVAPQYAGLSRLVRLFDREKLAAETALLDIRGLRLREGSTIMFTAHPSGALMVQAVSPGLVKEQQSYLLGSVYDPQLTTAIMSMFIDPDLSLDPGFTATAGKTLLAFVNGYRSGLQQQAERPALPGNSLEDGKKLLRQGKWRLPDVGQAPEQQPLVKGVRRSVIYQQITAAFDSAMRAAAAVEAPQDEDLQDVNVQRRVLFARRRAAETELKQQLSKLGLDVSGLSLQGVTSEQQLPQDLLSLARPLQPGTVAPAPAVALER